MIAIFITIAYVVITSVLHWSGPRLEPNRKLLFGLAPNRNQ